MAEPDRYRCVVLFNTWRMSEVQRQKIQRLLKDKPTEWLYAPGYCGEATEGGEMTLHFRSGRAITVQLPPYTTAVFDEDSGEQLL